ncbi:MAG: hypothetical protein KAR36_03565 [Candidatus Latescibacteria bacterium]|nr:hypothetical protein [Candidatus Latescibacterota bacterium]
MAPSYEERFFEHQKDTSKRAGSKEKVRSLQQLIITILSKNVNRKIGDQGEGESLLSMGGWKFIFLKQRAGYSVSIVSQ